MTLQHYYNETTDEIEFRWSVWPHYAYETMPQSQWTDFLGQVICDHILRKDPLLVRLKVRPTIVSPAKMAEIGEFVDSRLTGEELHHCNEDMSL